MAENLASKIENSDNVGGFVVLKDQFTVDLDNALPGYDVSPSIAYYAAFNADRSRPVMALVGDPQLPMRVDKIDLIRGMDTNAVLRVHDWGVLDIPSEDRRCPVVIVDRPLGTRVMSGQQKRSRPIHEDDLVRMLIRPVVDYLEILADHNLTHRAIRPDNLFYADEERSRIVLGDYISAPPAFAQQTVFETIESGMALPAGRGEGGPENDLYSFGVSILGLLIGKIPLNGFSDDQVIEEKLRHGSYNALVRRERLSLTMMEVLRGLLNDDPKERWTANDLMFWLQGRRQNPKPSTMARKAGRPFLFNGIEYQTTPELSNAFANNWDIAIAPIKDGSLDAWLRRGFGDEELLERVKWAIDEDVSAKRTDDFLISRVCIALDPRAPIRYRELRATIDGLGLLLGIYLHDNNICELVAKVIMEQLPSFWLKNQRRKTSLQEKFTAEYERARSYVDRIGIGLGQERVAYDFNPNLPCRSLLFTNDYVVGVEELLPAMERLAIKGGELIPLVDRNCAAFLASKMDRLVAEDLRDLDNQIDTDVSLIASVKILAKVQYSEAKVQDSNSKRQGQRFNNLAKAIAAILDPSIERYYSSSSRKQVRDGLKRAMRSGSLSQLVNVVSNPNNITADANAFKQAVSYYARTVQEIERLEYEKTHKEHFARELGAQVAEGVSGFISCIACVLFIVLAFL